MRLLIRGGSIPAGLGVKKNYVDIVQEYCADKGIELINRSRPKETSFNGIWSFYEDIDPFKPDILMIHFGIDDAFCPVYRSEFKENLVQMVRLARKRFGPVIMLATSQPFDDPYEMEAVYIYYRTIREVCLDLECEMIPVHSYWAGYVMEKSISNSDLIQKDNRYPNEKGHEVFAEAIIHKLDRLVIRRIKD
jgi:lysophospholipase L1-like esterase